MSEIWNAALLSAPTPSTSATATVCVDAEPTRKTVFGRIAIAAATKTAPGVVSCGKQPPGER